MKPMLESVKKGIKDIVNLLKNDNLDVEVCIIDVKDVNQINSPQVIQINGTPAPQAEGNRTLSFTNDTNQIETIVDNLVAEGGYDYFTLGTQMAGVAYTTTLPFRNGANKFVLLITDKSTGIKNYHGYSSTFALLDDLKAKNISFSASSMNRDLGGSIPDNTVQSYRRYISRGNGIFVPLRNFDFEVNIFTDFVLTNLIEQKEFTILGNTDLEEITLVEPLVKGGQTHSDKDGLTDSEEVDWSYDRISYTSNGYELPTLKELWFDIDKAYNYDLEDFPFLVEFSQIKVLPLLSHPKKIDSDNDGYTDDEDESPFKILITKCHQDIINLADKVKWQEYERMMKVQEWTTMKCLVWIDKDINSEQGKKYLDEFENQWILCYKNVILDAAEIYNIPPYLIAGVLKIELGGEPLWVDDAAYVFRKFLLRNEERADKTSFGNISMQVGVASETLCYNYEYLSDFSRRAILDSLKDNIQGIYIMAKHLSYLRDVDYKGVSALDLTERQVRNIATRYNFGASVELNVIENTSGYGQHVIDYKSTLEGILYGQD